MEQNEEKISLQNILICFRKKPLYAGFFHVFIALALFSSTDSQPTTFQF